MQLLNLSLLVKSMTISSRSFLDQEIRVISLMMPDSHVECLLFEKNARNLYILALFKSPNFWRSGNRGRFTSLIASAGASAEENNLICQQGEKGQYAESGVFECLPCAEGCESCEDDSPCVVSLNWLMRTAILILECCIIACLPAVVLFTWKYGHVKVGVNGIPRETFPDGGWLLYDHISKIDIRKRWAFL